MQLDLLPRPSHPPPPPPRRSPHLPFFLFFFLPFPHVTQREKKTEKTNKQTKNKKTKPFTSQREPIWDHKAVLLFCFFVFFFFLNERTAFKGYSPLKPLLPPPPTRPPFPLQHLLIRIPRPHRSHLPSTRPNIFLPHLSAIAANKPVVFNAVLLPAQTCCLMMKHIRTRANGAEAGVNQLCETRL